MTNKHQSHPDSDLIDLRVRSMWIKFRQRALLFVLTVADKNLSTPKNVYNSLMRGHAAAAQQRKHKQSNNVHIERENYRAGEKLRLLCDRPVLTFETE